MGAEYRIEFSIQRRRDGEDDFTEIGFGSSGAWDDTDAAVHMVGSAVENYDWETQAGMPDPESVKAELEARDG